LTVVPDPGPRGGHTAGPAADTLEDAVADLARQHPALTVTIDRRGSDWIETLIEHSARAGLLVIGSHHCDDRWSVRVGTAAGLLLRRASSPVMLIGGSASAETLERDRQKAGV
jgi:nucleotide-binding universal stress UspA family protein